VCYDVSFVTLCMCYMCHVIGRSMRMFLWSAVVFYEGESQQQACGEVCTEVCYRGAKRGKGELMFRQGGAQQLEVG
jgi:hypothetical protein